MTKVLLIAGLDRSLVNFRSTLIRDLIGAGCSVVAAAPAENADVPPRLEALGARFVGITLARAALNPFADFQTYARLRRLIAQERPDLVLSYTIKPVIYGSLAAAAERTPAIYALITGLGTAFHTGGLKGRLLSTVAAGLYRAALRKCRRVIVQNRDIADLFVRRGIAPREQVVVVRGSGIDLTAFAERPVPDGPARFLYLGRLLRDKGLREYAEAAADVKRSLPLVECRIMGATDPNPTGISLAEVSQWEQAGAIRYVPHEPDVRPRLAECSVYVLPSYHEGLPRSVLEAMAVGRAIITTDAMGCRETIRVPPGTGPDAYGIVRGENGLLVPARDARALAEAMRQLAGSPDLVRAMGRRSRVIAEEEFDVRHVNRAMLAVMGLPERASP